MYINITVLSTQYNSNKCLIVVLTSKCVFKVWFSKTKLRKFSDGFTAVNFQTSYVILHSTITA